MPLGEITQREGASRRGTPPIEAFPFQVQRSGDGLRVSAVLREGQERHLARPLDRDRQLPLVPGAIPGNAARQNLGSFRKEATKSPHFLIVDRVYLINAKRAYLSASSTISGHSLCPLLSALKRNIIGVEVVIGSKVHRSAACASRWTVSRPIEELHVIGDHLGLAATLPFVLILPNLKPTVDSN